MLGGTDAESEADARRLSASLGRGVEEGEHVEEGPCVPEYHLAAIREQWGRPCPRVELDPDNVDAATLAFFMVQPHLRPLFDPYYAASLEGDPPEVRRALLIRVSNAVHSEQMLERLYPDKKGR